MLSRIIKSFVFLLIWAIVLFSVYLFNLFYMKPVSIDHYLGKEIIKDLTSSPEYMTYLGIFDDLDWLTGHNSKISIPEYDDIAEDLNSEKRKLDILTRYNDKALSPLQQTTKQIAIFDTKNNIQELEDFPLHYYPLNQIGGAHLNAIEFLSDMHQIDSYIDAKNYIQRASLFDESFEGLLTILEKQAEENIYAPDFVYVHVINQLDELMNHDLENHPLYSQFVNKISKTDISEENQIALAKELEEVINNHVTRGFGLLKDFMVKTQKYANTNDGIWSLPNGDEYYQLQIRSYTTTDYTANEIHEMGVNEVKRISNRMSEILKNLGYDTENKSVGQIMNDLNEDPKFLYADTPDRKDIVVADYTAMVKEAQEVMVDYFVTMPKADVIVKAVPEYSEQTAAGGYYQSPALDGSRPGVFYANLYDIKQTPTYSMRTLAYHEATPGHHHQIAHSLENESLTLYRRFGYRTSAFSEGWALYSEQLALEAGLASNKYDELGILQSELFRAVRLVVDTGMHHKKWSREKAMDYMKSKTGMSDTEVRVEIERYLVWPGQALSYKVGMIKMLELRNKAMSDLGSKFDIKKFHSAVLDHGIPPLFIVEQKIDEMIEESL
ncbi:MAG: lipoprotein [SAR86 cluster bacterium SAR86B]|uniref:Lipoprotein n=1 Tax=SAR86 cluster bacterium SAR86B TaxID=1123867 RepID=J5KQV5_9GAMM|nr:MAG: lipoprotein [SAR86 cluster bacterium SAR86B]